MRRKILICLYAYYPFENANTNVMLPLINKLKETYDIYILSENMNNMAPKYEIMEDGINVYRYKMHSKIVRILHILANADLKKKRIWYKTFILRILCLFSRIFKKIKPHSEYLYMKKLMKENSFDFVITTCEDFHSHRNMLNVNDKIKNQVPWIAYFMDPHAYYIGNSGVSGDLLKLECKVYEKADLILVTEEIYRENHNNAFTPYLYKTFPYKFGNFRCLNADLINDIFVPGKINCVYVGSLLNEQIRSPRYLYEIINHVDESFCFHFVCNNMSEQSKRLYEKMIKDRSKTVFYHNLPIKECLGIMNHADILINLGNKSENQTPSKIFDYIGTGRPIVNFYSLSKDTSKFYLEKYANKINIYEDNEKIVENAKIFSIFAKENKGNVISKEILNDVYSIYNSEKVTTSTIEIIDDFLLKRRKNINV